MNPGEICRTCLRQSGTMRDLFEANPDEDEDMRIVDLLIMFTEISIFQNDGFPNQICIDCLDEIQRAYSFKKKCHSSDAVLKKLKFSFVKIENDKIAGGTTKKNELPNEELIEYETMDDSNTEEDQNKTVVAAKHENSVGQTKSIESETRRPIMQNIKEEAELNICVEDQAVVDDVDVAESSENVWRCPLCLHNCPNVKHLCEKHIVDRHMEGKICKLCNEEFQCTPVEHCSKHLDANVRNTLAKNQFQCLECSKILSTRVRYKRHMQTHTERKFECRECRAVFTDRYKLNTHMTLIHDGNCTVKCNICQMKFVKESKFIEHMRDHRNERRKTTLNCELCGRKFQYQNNLKKHVCVKVVSPIRHECDVCLKFYKTKKSLGRHMKLHLKKS